MGTVQSLATSPIFPRSPLPPKGAERIWPGGTVVEVKCPFREGSPSPHLWIPSAFMPQLQGQLMATGAARLHLVSWSPYGATVFHVPHDIDYQQQMSQALALFVNGSRARNLRRRSATARPLPELALEQGNGSQALDPHFDRANKETLWQLSKDLRERSIELAKRAECIARIPPSDCVTIVQETTFLDSAYTLDSSDKAPLLQVASVNRQ
eukprot:scaffold152222_cov35-Tisochrysis_lutea.AAC.2